MWFIFFAQRNLIFCQPLPKYPEISFKIQSLQTANRLIYGYDYWNVKLQWVTAIDEAFLILIIQKITLLMTSERSK